MTESIKETGIHNIESVFRNLSTPAFYEQAIRRREGMVAHLGPLVVRTGDYTGRSPDDKFIVREPGSENDIWRGEVNRPFESEAFDRLHARLLAYLQGKDVFVQDCYAGADPTYRVPIRVVTEDAWHSLFARNMFVRILDPEELVAHRARFTILCAPRFHASPEVDGTHSEAFVIVHFGKGLILIGGTGYAGEIKKAVFTVLNYLLPNRSVLGMHCSANCGTDGDVALFFGLSGTGKTTLSTVNDRAMIGDDEHGWSDSGVFNFEGGCYAKAIGLDAEKEPEIFQATRRFGTILENVAMDVHTRRVDLNDDSLTENTRASYPLTHLPNIVKEGAGPHPKNIFMLTADAFGVLPPIAKLTPDQAMYHFLSGYTAKVAGTERGVTEPRATFSPCFGAPFMVLDPSVYAEMLGDKIRKHEVDCWLVNTGWTGGPYGEGHRMELPHTRAMIHSALSGHLAEGEYQKSSVLGLSIPTSCEGVPAEILDPRETWNNKKAYDEKAKELASRFHNNFSNFEEKANEDVRNAGPKTNE